MKRTMCLILVLLAYLPSQALPQESVYFADSNLKVAVEEALGISDPTPDDMLGLFFLDASNRGIVDLTGIEYATSLLELGLANNEINDITSLSGLTSILWLDMSYNQIRNISGLSELTNIVFLFLNDNQISDISALSDFYFLLYLDLRHNPLNEDAHEIYIPLIYDNNLGLHPFWWPIDYDPPFSYYELKIESTDGGSVTIPGEGTFYYYDQESIVELEATTEPNGYFINWAGTAVDAGKVADPCSTITTIIIDADYTLWANFASNENGYKSTYITDNFEIHYYTTGENAVELSDKNHNNIPDFVEEVGKAFENAHDYLVNTLGFDSPLYPWYLVLYPDRYVIKIVNIGEKCGDIKDYIPFVDFTSIKINNRLSTINPPPNSGTIPGNYPDSGIIQFITAHEYFHAIQFRTVGWFMIDFLAILNKLWIPEGSAEWAGYKTFTNYYSPTTEYPNAENEFTNTVIEGYLGQTDRSLFKSGYSAGLYWYYIDQKFGTSKINEIWSYFDALGSPLTDSRAEYAIDMALADKDYDFEKSFKDFSKENYFWELYNHVKVRFPFILNIGQLPYSNIHHLPERATSYFKIIASDADNVRINIKDPDYDSKFFARAYPNENSQDEVIIPINMPIEIAGNNTVIIVDRFAGLNPLAEDAFEINVAAVDQGN